jgi:hypothetical protein
MTSGRALRRSLVPGRLPSQFCPSVNTTKAAPWLSQSVTELLGSYATRRCISPNRNVYRANSHLRARQRRTSVPAWVDSVAATACAPQQRVPAVRGLPFAYLHRRAWRDEILWERLLDWRPSSGHLERRSWSPLVRRALVHAAVHPLRWLVTHMIEEYTPTTVTPACSASALVAGPATTATPQPYALWRPDGFGAHAPPASPT